MTHPADNALRVGFISLGCPKNLVDSEVMMGILTGAGATLVPDPAEADVVVVNTCGFIDAAREESIQTILEAAQLKSTAHVKRLVVAGCLVQRSHDELREAIPEIDAFCGLDDIPGILGIAAPELSRPAGAATPAGASPFRVITNDGKPSPRRASPAAGAASASGPTLGGAGSGPPVAAGPAGIGGQATWLYDDRTPRLLSGPRHSAYLKIAEGCDNPCAFCAIPSFRGQFRSRRLGSILAEADALVAQGVRELNLIAQDSTHYGHDLGFADGPARLLRALDAVEGLRWIRLFYVYPNRLTDELLDTIAQSDRVVKYLDMPLQSASRTVLARMKRGGSSESHGKLIARMRARIPDLVLRSTYIVGFPGETEDEFEETLRFVEAAELDHAGAFTYSHEDRVPAAALADDVPPAVKEERRVRLLEVQEKVATAKNRARLGTTLEVLCEGVHPESDDLLVGRHAGQAPEIDGSVILNEGFARTGAFVRAEVVESHPFDLVARIVSADGP